MSKDEPDQVEVLLAEIASLQDLRVGLGEIAATASGVANRALAQIEAMQPVVEAALAWHNDPGPQQTFVLAAACHKYKAPA